MISATTSDSTSAAARPVHASAEEPLQRESGDEEGQGGGLMEQESQDGVDEALVVPLAQGAWIWIEVGRIQVGRPTPIMASPSPRAEG